jgi:hypothetical protein
MKIILRFCRSCGVIWVADPKSSIVGDSVSKIL